MEERWNAVWLMKKTDVSSMIAMPNGEIYLTNKNGLYKYHKGDLVHLETGTFRSLEWDQGNRLFLASDKTVIEYLIETATRNREWFMNSDVWGLAMDHDNQILYAGRNSTIQKVDLQRKVMEFIRLGYEFGDPKGMTCLKGKVYIAELRKNIISVFETDFVETVAGCTLEQSFLAKKDHSLMNTFVSPTGITTFMDGTLLIINRDKIQRMDLKKKRITTIWKLEEPPDDDYEIVIRCVATDIRGNIFVGTTDGILLLKCNTWKWQRFLWIGRLKEEASYCNFVRLPKEIIKEIAFFVYVIDLPLPDVNQKKRKRNK